MHYSINLSRRLLKIAFIIYDEEKDGVLMEDS